MNLITKASMPNIQVVVNQRSSQESLQSRITEEKYEGDSDGFSIGGGSGLCDCV